MEINLISIFCFIFFILLIYENFTIDVNERFSNEKYINRSDDLKDKKILVLYVFHQYNDRVKHFIKECIFYDENVTFLLICNDAKEFHKSKSIDCPDYVRVIKRENIGYDFAGWSEGLFQNDYYKGFDYFLFINSSVMGPFQSKDDKRNYVDIYVEPLNKNNIKLFGSTINTQENPTVRSHVQSYIFSVDRESLDYLIKKEIFSLSNISNTFQNAIDDKEIKMSRVILENNWNIGCLHKYYNNVDFRFKTKESKDPKMIKYLSKYGDIMMKQFHNKVWTYNELVFVKGNRLDLNSTANLI
tara:strand:- start:2400 stop:3299 length:900 start_codon:yes stop_codon:yes gene_type:complete